MKFAIYIILLALTTCIAQITGTLVTDSNQPLSGCEVKMGPSVVLSDSIGSFQINSTTSIAPLASEPKWKILDNTFTFALPESKRFGFEIFNVRGDKLGEFEPRLLAAGDYSINPFSHSGIDRGTAQYIVRFSSGAETLLSGSLKRSAAAIDSLQIKCKGYALLKVAVGNNSEKLGNIMVSIPDSSLPGIHVDYNPYSNMSNNWYKVITHSHTIAHEAGRGTTPVKIAQAYKDLGIHAVAFTDHDALTKPAAISGILYIPGEEVTTNDGDMNVFAINKAVSANMTGQKVIDAAIQNGNGFTQVNHPLDSDANDDGRLLPYLSGLKNLWGLEIYNGGRLSEDGTAAWDHLISQKKRVWATAGDDAHSILVIDDGTGIPETGRKWIVVNSAENTVDGILASMRSGRFYASEGPDMNITVQGDAITVTSTAGNSVSWYTTARKLIKKTTLSGQPDRYTITGSEVFVRVLVTDSKGKRAASQPIFTK